MKTFFRLLLGCLLGLLMAGLGLAAWNLRDRFPDPSPDLQVAPGPAAPLRVGFAKVRITPLVADQWVDQNGDAQFNEADGDTWTDGNGNGQFDPIWLAGFQNRRPAQGVHDHLWARAMVIDDGRTRLALVGLDLIGFGYDEVQRTRQLISPQAGITYSIFAASHTHEGPDFIGMWGASEWQSGFDPDYAAFVRRQAAQAVELAAASLRPARLRFAQDLAGPAPLVADTRDPQVFDTGLRLVQALDAEADTTLGVLLSHGNHPETLWSQNLLITSDYVHYWREALENGLPADSLRGLGGTAVFFPASIGGLMTTHPGLGIPGPDSLLRQPSFAKAEAQGHQLARLSLAALAQSPDTLRAGALGLRTRTLLLPVDNPLYRLGGALGLFDRGFAGWFKLRTEIAAFTLGPASFLAVPGEIYPELVDGGTVAPEGRDFAEATPETPPLRQLLPGRYRFVLGLANDEIGYILPRSQWDAEPPYTFGQAEAPYGEINSLGPQTAPRLHAAYRELLAGWGGGPGAK
jgi:hypothetical protein